MNKKFRYPGARPFTAADRHLFFGRERDIRALSDLIALEPLVVLFGKSGYGKTSLLQAGVLPELRDTEKHRTLELRLEAQDAHPLDLILDQLKTCLGAHPFVGDQLNIENELPDDLTALLWCYLKSLQMSGADVTWNLLVFDHFEEAFSFHQPHVESLGRALAEMLRPRPPKSIRWIIKKMMQAGADGISEEDVDAWLKPLNLKVLLSVRHDHLGSLDALKPSLPYIFKHTYELKPLSGPQALAALQEPAALTGDFDAPPFTYHPKALDKIVKSLSDKRTQRIETFQLQLIAQHAEEAIIAKAAAQPELSTYELTPKDLGNPETIFEDHYREIIEALPRSSRRKARDLVEKRLIINGNRIPLPQQMITDQYHIPLRLVNTLVERRLLRSQLNSVGSTSLEVSHDTLVPPIQKTARKHRQKVLWQRIRLAALIGLIALSGFASWGVYEMNLAEDYKKERDSLANRATYLQNELNRLLAERDRRSQNPQVENPEDSMEVQRIIDSLMLVIATSTGPAAGSETPVTNPVITEPISPTFDPNPKVVLPSQIHLAWLEKLDRLKTKLSASPDIEYRAVGGYNGPSDSRDPQAWELNPEATHVLAVRVNTGRRVFDARNPKTLFVVLSGGKVHKFLGGTGFFTPDGELAFLPKGQHLLKLDSRSKKELSPFKDGVVLIRDVDRDGELTVTDTENGPMPNPATNIKLRWFTGTGAIDEAGEHLIFDHFYVDSDNSVLSGSGGKGAFDRFFNLVWEPGKSGPVYYTIVDLTEFDPEDQVEMLGDIDRLTVGPR